MSDRAKYYILYTVGMIFCIVPAVLAAVEYFPIWKKVSPAVLMSGICVSGMSIAVMACVAAPPILKFIKQKFAAKTPSAWVGFLIAAVLFRVIASVVDALFVIFFIAAVSNLIAQLLFWWSDKYKVVEKEEKTDE